jgi:hypothetical protein
MAPGFKRGLRGCAPGSALRLLAAAAAIPLLASISLACGGSRGSPAAEPDPMALRQQGKERLSSQALDIHLRLHEGGARRLPLAVVRLTNLTRAPIYPLLDRIALQRPGEEPQQVSLACDREIVPMRRLAPAGVRWCSDLANPRESIDLPVALAEIPPEGSVLAFDLLVPIIFDSGDPRTVRWSNLVDRNHWRLRPADSPPGPPEAE